MLDVVVAGAGPAGWALAGQCARAGLTTELVDPSPGRVWHETYAAWRAELPAGLGNVLASAGEAVAIGTRTHALGWDYAVLDNAALRDAVAARAVRAHRGRALAVASHPRGGVTVELDGGSRRAALLVDATGQRRAVLGGGAPSPAAEQTAIGVVTGEASAAPLVPPGRAVFMDWRVDHGEPGWPTFLYGVPLGGGRVLLEETSLARRPGLSLSVLRRRLRARLHAHGIEHPGGGEERVRFAVDTPLPGAGRWCGPVLPFGAAAPLIHPASGFSVAAALRLAPRVADAIRSGLDVGPHRAARCGWQAVWSPAALATHALRRAGLQALLSMPPDRVPQFFDAFFDLASRHRWAYLTGREDPVATAAAMGALVRTAPRPVTRHLVLHGLDPRRVVHDPP